MSDLTCNTLLLLLSWFIRLTRRLMLIWTSQDPLRQTACACVPCACMDGTCLQHLLGGVEALESHLQCEQMTTQLRRFLFNLADVGLIPQVFVCTLAIDAFVLHQSSYEFRLFVTGLPAISLAVMPSMRQLQAASP